MDTNPSEVSIVLKITNPVGLHARPAALFVQKAGEFQADVKVRNITRDTPFVDAKSILGVMGIGVAQDHEIEVVASGEDAAEAIAALQALVESNFGEDEEDKAEDEESEAPKA
ncbi:MAG: HPr family phosphocarrier protein [Chloroflexi bacterium]|nr:HPr family phosphocarrier protein [Chloroflexota bacterium]